MCPGNTGFTLAIFFKLSPMKGAKRYMEITLMLLWRKSTFGANGPFFGLKMLCPHNSESILRIFLTFFTISLIVFQEKKYHFGKMSHFWSQKWLWLYDSGSTVSFFLIYQNKRGQSYMKIKLMTFVKKRLIGVNGLFWTRKYTASSKQRIHSKDFS